jgi:hypothetical protein
VSAKSKLYMTERLMGVEVVNELGTIVAELGSGTDLPLCPYVNMWVGLGVALENNQAVENLVRKITQQARATAGRATQASQKTNQAGAEVVGAIAQIVIVAKKQRDEEVTGVNLGR